MTKKELIAILVVVSMVLLLIGFIWKTIDPENNFAFICYFTGWVASLLAVGYVSTPSGSVYGKVSFVFVCIMVTGIVLKILHLQAANEMIIGGLLGLVITYLVAWLKREKN